MEIPIPLQHFDTLVITFLRETHHNPNVIIDFLSTIRDKKYITDQTKVILLINSWFKYENLNIPNNVNVIYLDYFLFQVYKHYKDRIVEWNSNALKFLCLTGKADRINRIGLLYKLYQQNLLSDNKCIWSLPTTQINRSHIINLLGIENVNSFISQFSRSFGDTYKSTGVDCPEEIFTNSKFQIVTETYFSNSKNPWITEKTWLALKHQMPFIIAGDTYTLDKLSKMGFRTFSKYLKNPNYDTILEPVKRVEVIVENIEDWMVSIIDYKHDIKNDVEHNYNRFLELGSVAKSLVSNLIDELSLESFNNLLRMMDTDVLELYHKTETELIINLNTYILSNSVHPTFKEWYNIVRGPDWPMYYTGLKFEILPEWVKKECINEFDYYGRDFRQ